MANPGSRFVSDPFFLDLLRYLQGVVQFLRALFWSLHWNLNWEKEEFFWGTSLDKENIDELGVSGTVEVSPELPLVQTSSWPSRWRKKILVLFLTLFPRFGLAQIRVVYISIHYRVWTCIIYKLQCAIERKIARKWINSLRLSFKACTDISSEGGSVFEGPDLIPALDSSWPSLEKEDIDELGVHG